MRTAAGTTTVDLHEQLALENKNARLQHLLSWHNRHRAEHGLPGRAMHLNFCWGQCHVWENTPGRSGTVTCLPCDPGARSFRLHVRCFFLHKNDWLYGLRRLPPLHLHAKVARTAIADVLVRRFAQVYENVYTFCLVRPADGDATDFACPWLVAMSAKADGTLRVGCGSYAWRRQSGAPWLVERLVIEIDAMRELPAEASRAVFDWVRHLPYPWCPPAAAACVPEGVGLEVVARALDRQPARH